MGIQSHWMWDSVQNYALVCSIATCRNCTGERKSKNFLLGLWHRLDLFIYAFSTMLLMFWGGGRLCDPPFLKVGSRSMEVTQEILLLNPVGIQFKNLDLPLHVRFSPKLWVDLFDCNFPSIEPGMHLVVCWWCFEEIWDYVNWSWNHSKSSGSLRRLTPAILITREYDRHGGHGLLQNPSRDEHVERRRSGHAWIECQLQLGEFQEPD